MEKGERSQSLVRHGFKSLLDICKRTVSHWSASGKTHSILLSIECSLKETSEEQCAIAIYLPGTVYHLATSSTSRVSVEHTKF